jgi:hypothetical protein
VSRRSSSEHRRRSCRLVRWVPARAQAGRRARQAPQIGCLRAPRVHLRTGAHAGALARAIPGHGRPSTVAHHRPRPAMGSHHAWVASTWSTATGLRWSPDVGWRHFLKDGHSVRRLTRYRVSPVPGLILVELSFIAHRPPPSAPLALHPIRLVVPDDHQRLAIGDLLHEFGSSRVGGASRVQQHTADAVPLAGRRWSRLLP